MEPPPRYRLRSAAIRATPNRPVDRSDTPSCPRWALDATPSGVASGGAGGLGFPTEHFLDRKSTRLNSSHRTISYAVFCLKKKKTNKQNNKKTVHKSPEY